MTIPLVLIQESNLSQPWPTTIARRIWELAGWSSPPRSLVMLCIVPSKRTWLRTHILDVAVTVLTPPFDPAAWQAGRAYRVLRLLRLLRIFSLRRLLSLDGLKVAALTAVLTVGLGGIIVASIETTAEEPWTAWTDLVGGDDRDHGRLRRPRTAHRQRPHHRQRDHAGRDRLRRPAHRLHRRPLHRRSGSEGGPDPRRAARDKGSWSGSKRSARPAASALRSRGARGRRPPRGCRR